MAGLESLFSWARSKSLWIVATGPTCCADELMQTIGCRYDLERFGGVVQIDPSRADILIIQGTVSEKAAPELKKLYDSMKFPKYVMALGSCSVPGHFYDDVVLPSSVVPVDVMVPGCPPRPESIMYGLMKLQKIMQKNEVQNHGEVQ